MASIKSIKNNADYTKSDVSVFEIYKSGKVLLSEDEVYCWFIFQGFYWTIIEMVKRRGIKTFIKFNFALWL